MDLNKLAVKAYGIGLEKLLSPNVDKEHGQREGGLNSKGNGHYYTCKCGRVFTGDTYEKCKTKYLHHIYWARELSKKVK